MLKQSALVIAICLILLVPQIEITAQNKTFPSIEPDNVTRISKVATIPNLILINDIVWSPDGNLLAIADNARVKVYDVHSLLAPKATLTGHTFAVNSITFSPDGTLIASGGNDGTIRIWNIWTGRQQALHKAQSSYFGPEHAMPIYAVAFNPDGKNIAYGTEVIATAYVWDIHTDIAATFEDDPNGFVKTVAFSPDGSSVLGAGGWYSTIRVWDMKSGDPLPPLTEHRNGVYKLAFDHSGTLLASAGFDGIVRMWNMTLNKLQMVSPQLDDTFLSDVSFNRSGTLVACGGIDGLVHFLDVKTGSILLKVPLYTDGKPMNVAFNPSGTLLAVANQSADSVQLWGIK